MTDAKALWTCQKCGFYNDSPDYICCECNHHNSLDIAPQPIVDLDETPPDASSQAKKGKKIIIKKKVVKKSTNKDIAGNNDANADNLTDSPQKTLAAMAFDDESTFQLELESKSQQPEYTAVTVTELPLHPQTEPENTIDIEHEQILIENIDLPPQLNALQVTVQQNALHCTTQQLNSSNTPIQELLSHYQPLTLLSIFLWVTTIAWFILYKIDESYHGQHDENHEIFHNLRLVSWWASLLGYIVYTIMYFPILDPFMKFRHHRYCDILYSLRSSTQTFTTSPVQMVSSLRFHLFQSPALLTIKDDVPHNTVPTNSNTAVSATYQAEIVNGSGSDEEINFNGVGLINLFNSAGKLIFITLQIENKFASIDNQCNILQYLSNLTHHPVTLASIFFSDEGFGGRGNKNAETITMHYMVLPPQLLHNNQNENSADVNQSLLSNGGDSASNHPIQPKLTGIYRVIMNSFTHFLFYAMVLEPLYLFMYFSYITSVKICSDRLWSYSQGP